MFKSAKVKLTLSYLAILTVITVSFSVFVYTNVLNMTGRALENQSKRLERRMTESFPRARFEEMPPLLDPDTLVEIRDRTLILLIWLNIAILGISGALSYFLAGVTLKPIEIMLNKQKRFVSDAAHELKTPLTAMKTDFEVTLRGKNLSVQDSKLALEGAVVEIDKLNGFVNKLLKQSKYENGAQMYKKETMLISEVVKSAVNDVKLIARQSGIEILFKNSEHQAHVYGDKDALRELFRNLLENAVKYSNKNSEVTVSISIINNDVITEVKDKGVGISETDLDKIFDPFYRSDLSRTKNNIDGFGLGLSICKEIVNHHNGNIKVTSQPGAGSMFKVILPIASKTLSGSSQNI